MTMPFRTYNRIIAALVLPVLAVLLATGSTLEGYTGDLTRLGGYSEKQYGWTEPQLRFGRPLFTQYSARRFEYTGPADVVVVGDSFTFQESVSWINYLVQTTGLRVQSFRMDKMPIHRLVTSAGFRKHPPRILIYESIERDVWGRMRELADRWPDKSAFADCRLRPTPRQAAYRSQPVPVETGPYSRKGKSALYNFSLSWDFLYKNAAREILGRNPTLVERIELAADAPLSSSDRRRLLVFKHDLHKARITPPMWEQTRCELVRLQNRVQANGRTFFVAMIAPDKLTAYAELLADPAQARLSRIDILARDPGLHLPRIDQRLQRAVREGVTDVYLPNDTHWGSAGYQAAAEELADYLARTGVLAPAGRR